MIIATAEGFCNMKGYEKNMEYCCKKRIFRGLVRKYMWIPGREQCLREETGMKEWQMRLLFAVPILAVVIWLLAISLGNQ